MKETLQILDVCLNRAAEGIRVLEDLARYCLNDRDLTRELKSLRHGVRKVRGIPYRECLSRRLAGADPGPALSRMTKLDGKKGLESLIRANARRGQEALRSAEEMAKCAFPREGHVLEAFRFQLYDLEKRLQFARVAARRLRPFLQGGLYGLTDSPSSLKRGRDNVETVRILAGEGIGIIQYREKDLSPLEKFRECERIRRITEEAGALLVINDHPDIALRTGADGVHLGQDDLPLREVRALVGRDMLVGRSTHCPEQAREAREEGADYIGVGPLFATRTKRDVCAPVGLDYLDYAAAYGEIPFVAIGGIKRHNLARVVRRGGALAALVTEITGAEEPRKVIREIREIRRRALEAPRDEAVFYQNENEE